MTSLSETHDLSAQGTFYARFEGSETVDREQARAEEEEPPNSVIAFDAVDADWARSLNKSLFTVEASREEHFGNYWREMFGGGLSDPADDPYEPVPAYRIEVSLRPDHGHRWAERMLDARDQWFEFHLGDRGEHRVDVFRDLFDPEPAVAWIADAPKTVPPRLSRQLSTAFDMDFWPDASQEDLRGLFGSLPFPPIEQLISFDVGQGTATCLARDCRCLLGRDALRWHLATEAYGEPGSFCECLSRCIEEACACGLPICYFDLGCGVYRNARTRPHNIRFCNCSEPPVILSHWDTDHWAGALMDTRLLRSRWVAPRQNIGPTHAKFASKILQSGGSILIVPDRPLSVRWRGHREYITLQRATGRSRNDSGLVMQVWNRRNKKRWLLTGDADYKHIPKLPRKAAAITVPHHGASECGKPPPRPSNTSASRLLYSFGPGNKHGRYGVSHPRRATVDAHLNAGWKSPGWNSGTPGDAVANGTTLATAQHPCTHLGWAAAGWDRKPPPPRHLVRCLTPPPQS